MQTAAIFSNSAASIVAPVGFVGKFSISTFVRGVMFFSKSPARRANPSSARVVIAFGTPRAITIVGE